MTALRRRACVWYLEFRCFAFLASKNKHTHPTVNTKDFYHGNSLIVRPLLQSSPLTLWLLNHKPATDMAGMQLRDSSMRRRPGRYQEDDGPISAERPIFVHPDIPFNPSLTPFCAHPSLPLDYPGLGPSEAERLRRAALAPPVPEARCEYESDYPDESNEAETIGDENEGEDEVDKQGSHGSAGEVQSDDDVQVHPNARQRGSGGWLPPSRRHKYIDNLMDIHSRYKQGLGQEQRGERQVPASGCEGLQPLSRPRPAHVANIPRRQSAARGATMSPIDGEIALLSSQTSHTTASSIVRKLWVPDSRWFTNACPGSQRGARYLG